MDNVERRKLFINKWLQSVGGQKPRNCPGTESNRSNCPAGNINTFVNCTYEYAPLSQLLFVLGRFTRPRILSVVVSR